MKRNRKHETHWKEIAAAARAADSRLVADRSIRRLDMNGRRRHT